MDQQSQAESGYSNRQIVLAMTAIFAVYGVMTYFVQSLGIARPKMAAELNGMSLYAWAVSLPALVNAFATLIFGKFSDIYGRRRILMVSLAFALLGSILIPLSPNFEFLIVASMIGAAGSGSMMPLVFSVVGDIFAPDKRGKWIGLLNIPTLFFALIGPTMGGWFTDNLGWRWLYWISLPLLAFCLITVPMGVPSLVRKASKIKIDYLGCLLVAIALAAMIIGLSLAGTTYPWASVQVIGLLALSLVFWLVFIWYETGAEEPVLDPQVFRNRIFLTVAGASLFSFFGQIGIIMYFPMFLQGVQSRSTTLSGSIITPFSVIMAAVGIATGFLLARTKRFKWMYVLGFGLATADMFGIALFNEGTSIILILISAGVIGVGLGAVPTINTLVVQNTMPKKLLGVAMGAIFFCISMGVALAPAVLGSVWNSASARNLARSAPDELKRLDKETFDKLTDSKVLLSQAAMNDLEQSLKDKGIGDQALFTKTVKAIRNSMEAAFQSVFLVSAIAMLISFLLISTIPATCLDSGGEKNTKSESVPEAVSK
jgi:MFS family permease